jgi:hypothetical protein
LTDRASVTAKTNAGIDVGGVELDGVRRQSAGRTELREGSAGGTDDRLAGGPGVSVH